jgi:hypothetical protein
MMALELLGVGIASGYHRCPFGEAQIRLPQAHTLRTSQAIKPLDRRMEELGVGREGDGLGLNGSIHRHPLKVDRSTGLDFRAQHWYTRTNRASVKSLILLTLLKRCGNPSLSAKSAA